MNILLLQLKKFKLQASLTRKENLMLLKCETLVTEKKRFTLGMGMIRWVDGGIESA